MAALSDSLRAFFETKALSPHGICLLWRPELIWTHAVSDLLIGMPYADRQGGRRLSQGAPL